MVVGPPTTADASSFAAEKDLVCRKTASPRQPSETPPNIQASFGKYVGPFAIQTASLRVTKPVSVPTEPPPASTHAEADVDAAECQESHSFLHRLRRPRSAGSSAASVGRI